MRKETSKNAAKKSSGRWRGGERKKDTSSSTLSHSDGDDADSNALTGIVSGNDM